MSAGAAISAQGGKVQWQASIQMHPEQAESVRDASAEISAIMDIRHATSSISDGKLKLSGNQDMEQLRDAIFDDSAQWVDFLGGPIELTLTMPIGNMPVTLEMESRPATGYRWEVVTNKSSAKNPGPNFKMRYPGVGTPAIQTLEVRPEDMQNGQVRLIYRRSFEPDMPVHARLNLQMPETTSLIDLTDPTPSGLLIEDRPGDGQANPYAAPTLNTLPKVFLPSSYDARTLGIVPVVRNQGSCGSCWAFGTVGVMEIAVKKAGGALTDLSEQFLVSCNNDGWSCSGGWIASKYHHNTPGTAQTAIGAVLESTKPYTATNGSCTAAYSHPYKAATWQSINPSWWIVPTNDQIKNAIMTYGAVAAAVCADPYWFEYTGGVYSPTTNGCGNSVNHMVVLVGWNDATQSWILRNSWGTNWGEAGYMRIKYDPSGANSWIGAGASWINYVATTPAAPTTYSPSGEVYTNLPSYSWSRLSTVTSYKLKVKDVAVGTYPINGFTVTSTYCNTTTNRCSFTPNTPLSYNKVYQWQVSAGSGPYSALASFKPVPVTTYGPSGDTYTNLPTYSWSRLSAATSYKLKVKDVALGTYPINDLTVSSASCNATTNRCSFTPSTALTYNKAYQWQVAADKGAYTAFKSFKPVAGMNSQFSNSSIGWVQRPGGPWVNTTSTYYTNGLTNLISSASYNQTFGNFTYQARMKRAGTYSSGLIVRGTPTFDTDHDWLNAYQFLYSNNGSFSVWKGINGNWTKLKDWTSSAAIVKNDWNILKVIADGNQLRFYVNGALVWSGSDTSFTTGQVGLWMYRGAAVEKLEVDWATLGMSQLYTAVAPVTVSQVELAKHHDRFGKPLP